MLKKPITFADYDGNKVTEIHYFNLNKFEWLELEAYTKGGLIENLQHAIDSNNAKKTIDLLKKIILRAYGEKNEETGETTQIEGKKDELETAYSDLSERLNNFKKQLSEHQVSSLKSFDEVKTDWEQKFVVLEKEIQELLPNALTAGLSHAYSIKKELEI